MNPLTFNFFLSTRGGSLHGSVLHSATALGTAQFRTGDSEGTWKGVNIRNLIPDSNWMRGKYEGESLEKYLTKKNFLEKKPKIENLRKNKIVKP